MTLALAFVGHSIGFFGQSGLVWALLGFLVFCVVIAILFKIFFLAAPALGLTDPWISIIYWLMVLILFIAFINYAFGWGF